MKTKFEVGKTYKTRSGGAGQVIKIRSDQDPYPVQALLTVDDRHNFLEWLTADGLIYYQGTDGNDLLLPAIEPANEEFSGPTVAALTAYLDFWMAFRGDVIGGLIDPCGGGYFLLSDGARLKCDYPTREAALSEAAAVIADLEELLEGGAR